VLAKLSPSANCGPVSLYFAVRDTFASTGATTSFRG